MRTRATTHFTWISVPGICRSAALPHVHVCRVRDRPLCSGGMIIEMTWVRVALPIYWLVLAVATHYPHVRVPTDASHVDKVIHFGAFGVLAALFYFAVGLGARATHRRSMWLSLAVLLPYAVVDETTQQLFGRHTDPLDLGADAAGVVLALGIIELGYRRARRSR